LGGRFGGWREWDTEDALENTQKAMQVAEQALGIETVILYCPFARAFVPT
jgi:hypothetical protein